MLICLGENYFLIYNQSLTRTKFVEACSVREGSWAEEFANRLYDCLMGNTTDVREEYERFYKIEYPTLDDFLMSVYGVSKHLLKLLKKNWTSGDILAYGSFDSEGDYNMGQLMQFSDEIVEAVNKVLSKAKNNEDKK